MEYTGTDAPGKFTSWIKGFLTSFMIKQNSPTYAGDNA